MKKSKLKLSDFDYYLPKELIALRPMKPRDHSRLLVLDRKTEKIQHKYFFDIVDFLDPGDVLVVNDTKVFPARLIGKKIPHGGKIEVLLLMNSAGIGDRGSESNVWKCLVGGRGAREGLKVQFDKGLMGEIIKNCNDGTWDVKFNMVGDKMRELVEKIGKTPLPPYIKHDHRLPITDHKADYQTVYADDKKIGSVAAPTAGFHFTKALMNQLRTKDIQFEYVTLHVGLGTFAPVKEDDITMHKMHEEYVEIRKEVAERILQAKSEGRRVIAVGTTSVRALETAFQKLGIRNWEFGIGVERPGISSKNNEFQIPDSRFRAFTNIFIYPGYKFQVVDAMITNFHLPKSTLLMLVSAFAGEDSVRKAYRNAIAERYRFYSYGDAMLII